jgi:hypothetical protein
MTDPQRRRGGLLVLASLLAIAGATLIALPRQADAVAETSPWCLVCGSLGLVDVLLNIGLFLPLGAALRLRGLRLPVVAAVACLVSLGLELLQSMIPGRDPSLSDVLSNTVGGALGGAAAVWGHHLSRPAPRTAAALSVFWGMIWLIQTAAVGALLQPSLPRTWYWGQLAPELEQFEQFDGHVRSAAAGPNMLYIGRLEASAEVRRRLLRGEPLRATTTPGSSTPGVAPIVSIFDQQQREIVLLARWGDDLVYRLRTRAVDLRLRPPAVRLPAAFSGAEGFLDVAGRWAPDQGTVALTLDAAKHSVRRAVRLSTQWGWSLLLPFPYAHGTESPSLTAAWVLSWMVLLGYWSSTWSRPAVLGGAAIAALGLGALPLLLGLCPAMWSEWAAAALGLAAGGLLANRRVRGVRPPRRTA